MSNNKYSFWYSDIFTHKGYFTADSLQEADEMIRMVNAGEISLEDLTGFDSKVMNYELIAEPAEPVRQPTSSEMSELYEDKIVSDYLVGTPPKDIRSRFEGLIPTDQMDEILERIAEKYSEVIRWDD
jgi:hypothetical protein